MKELGISSSILERALPSLAQGGKYMAYKKLIRSMRILNETIYNLTIRFNLDVKQRAELRDLILEIVEIKGCNMKYAAKEVKELMVNKYKSIPEIRKMYHIQKIGLKEFQPDDAS